MSWKGSDYNSLTFLTKENPNAPPVVQGSRHTVLFELPLPDQGEPRPTPQKHTDTWDDDHVRMPNSPHSLYPSKCKSKNPNMVPRWQIIRDAFKKPINTADELHQTILKYNHLENWKFPGLKNFINKAMSEDERQHFFGKILPGIIDLALSISDVITSAIPLLQKDTNASISMSQKQAACILANVFLCTFPYRNKQRGEDYPSFTCGTLFNYNKPPVYEKLKCLIHYFEEVIFKGRDGVLTFSRQHIKETQTPQFERSNKELPKFHVTSVGGIEEADGLLQMDFADPYIGGIVFTHGLVQEEIRFLLSPELIVSRLFTEKLGPRDAFIIIGSERFSESTGYAYRFKWKAPHVDLTPRDEFRRRINQVVALDATNYRRKGVLLQYEQDFIKRDLIKAYAGFRPLDGSPGTPVAIATGNWGCGIFRGNPQLKGLLQLAAAAEAGREVAYFTFHDQKIRDQLWSMHQFLESSKVTVGQLISSIFEFGSKEEITEKDLYHHIKTSLTRANTKKE